MSLHSLKFSFGLANVYQNIYQIWLILIIIFLSIDVRHSSFVQHAFPLEHHVPLKYKLACRNWRIEDKVSVV